MAVACGQIMPDFKGIFKENTELRGVGARNVLAELDIQLKPSALTYSTPIRWVPSHCLRLMMNVAPSPGETGTHPPNPGVANNGRLRRRQFRQES